MKKYIITLLITAAIAIFIVFVQKAYAFSYTRVMAIRSTATNPYIVVCNKANWDVANKVTGVAASGETWVGNALKIGAGITRHTQSRGLLVALPPLNDETEWLFCVGDNASPDPNDMNSITLHVYEYSPTVNRVVSTEMPIHKGRILTK